ncbi:hypothetical protein PoB_001897700 [Plakobranchus ocellatus]|uniref:DUF4758 domain-containing protein n=1 Tax=Plakobranchus ocellatus TaxID=259542 RepID=A0AAV3ZDC2_9GAST|nr:hypothetical protein PoB_001897700 [Plakobranchus ocellatus]
MQQLNVGYSFLKFHQILDILFSFFIFRQETAHAFQAAYGPKVPAHFVNAMLSAWVESWLPRRCLKTLEVGGPFNPSSHNDHVGPLGTVAGPSTVYTTSIKEDVGVARQKREVTETEEIPNVRTKRFVGSLSGLSSMFPGMSMSMSGKRGAGQKEISESAQMMKTLLLISKIQKRKALQDVKRSYGGHRGYSGEKYNFGTGMYGDTYPGKRKRRSVSAKAGANAESIPSSVSFAGSASESSTEPLSRKKRFLFMGEPSDAPSGPAMPSMLSILMGTARDPATGKKVEFGGDYMKGMMRRSFMAAMPALAGNTPPGKEPPDVVKTLAPLWYFSRMQQAMSSNFVPPAMGGYNHYNTMHRGSPGSVKSRNRDGYYGDHFPVMGKRRRRSVYIDTATDVSDNAHSKRVKRAAGEGNNDVITIGDVSIPTDFFKPPERSEDPNYYGGYGKPDDPRYYNQYVTPHRNYYYQPHQQSQYHQQQQYYRQQLQRQKQQQQQQQQQFYHYYRHLYSLYLQVLQARNPQPTQNQWTRPATAPGQHPPAPVQQQAPSNYVQQPATQASHQNNPATTSGAQSPPPQTSAHNPFAPPHQAQPFMQNQQPFLGPPPPQPAAHFYAPPPAQSHYPPAPSPPYTYPIDPFIPNPPLPPHRITTPLPSRKKRSANLSELNIHLLRHKRSEDNDKTEYGYGNFYFPQSIFSPPFYSPFIPTRYPTFSNKVGYHQPRGGGIIYGDRLPWSPSSIIQPQTPARPPAQPKTSSPQRSATGKHANRRVKRSDKKDNPDSYPTFLFSPPLFSPFMSPMQPHDKHGYSTGRGGVIYGDQMPWAQQTSMRSYSPPAHLSTNPTSNPAQAPSGGLLDFYLNAQTPNWGHRG